MSLKLRHRQVYQSWAWNRGGRTSLKRNWVGFADSRSEGFNSFLGLASSETKITIAKRIVRRLLLLSRASSTRSFHVNLAVTGAAVGYYGAGISLTDSVGSASLKASCFRYSSKRSAISKKPFQNKLALDFKTLRATSIQSRDRSSWLVNWFKLRFELSLAMLLGLMGETAHGLTPAPFLWREAGTIVTISDAKSH